MQSRLGPDVHSALRQAAAVARERGHRHVGPAHLLAVLEGPGDAVERLLEAEPTGAGPPRMSSALADVLRRARTAAEGAGTPLVDTGHLLPELSGRPLPRHTRDLTEQARSGVLDPVVRRDREVNQVIRALTRRRRRCPLLVGPGDAGRAAIVDGVAHRLVAGDVPAQLRGRRLLTLDTAAFLANAPGPGRVERELRTLLEDIERSAGESILFVDDLDALLASGSAAAVLAACVAQGHVRFVGGAPDHLGGILASRLWPVRVEAASPADAEAILRSLAPRYERHHRVRIDDSALGAAVRLSQRYMQDRQLPGKAIDLLDEAASASAMAGRGCVDADEVAVIVSEQTGIPAARLLATEADRLLRLEDRLHERVVGQDEAVAAVAGAVRRARAGVADPDRPLGSFLFLGPTGVGKTELARTLAADLFANERALIRLDMSEYQEPQAVARLVGAPPGYVGYGEGGQLTERLLQHPYSVLLLDEIEKAHADVFNVLLAVLDEGRLTDGQGRTVDARNAVLIMTSNLGSRFILDPSLGHAELHERVMGQVRRSFRPEFLNRVDEVVIFHRLTAGQLGAIVDIQLSRLQERLTGRDLTLSVTSQARRWLAQRGYDPVYGARPLQRVIRRDLADRIAVAVLDGTIRDGQTVEVDADPGGELVVRRR